MNMQEESTFDNVKKGLIPDFDMNNEIQENREAVESTVKIKQLNIDARRRIEDYLEKRELRRLIDSNLENL